MFATATTRNSLDYNLAGVAAEEAAKEAQGQVAELDAEVNKLKGSVAKLEREVERLTTRNKVLEETNARSTRGLRAGRAVVVASKRRQAQMRQVCVSQSLFTSPFYQESFSWSLQTAHLMFGSWFTTVAKAKERCWPLLGCSWDASKDKLATHQARARAGMCLVVDRRHLPVQNVGIAVAIVRHVY